MGIAPKVRLLPGSGQEPEASSKSYELFLMKRVG